jgi:hypothetical protein
MADADNGTKNFLSPRTYDWLKFVAQIVLPLLGTLYFSLSELWNLPYGIQVVGTITAFDLFLGSLLKASSASYYKNGANFDGVLKTVQKEDGGEALVFDVQNDPETVVKKMGKHEFTFKIDRDTPAS